MQSRKIYCSVGGDSLQILMIGKFKKSDTLVIQWKIDVSGPHAFRIL